MFRYRALDRQGLAVAGQLRAPDATAATRELLAQGLTPLEVSSTETSVQAASPLQPSSRRRVGARDLQGLLLEMGTLLKAGISLAEALPSLVSAYARHPLGPALSLAHQRLRAGAALSASLEQPQLPWPGYVMALIKAGEASGEMGQALHDAASQMEHELTIGRELRNALIYPAVLVLAGVVAVLIIFIGVVPRFSGMLKGSRADIPALSRWVIESGTWLQQNIGTAALGAAGAGLVLASLLGQQTVRAAILQALAKWPVLGTWLNCVDIGRWAMVLGTLLGNRVPIIDALRLSAATLRLKPLREGLTRGAVHIQQGRPLSEVLEQLEGFPTVRLSLIRVGERSGELARMLRSLGELETQASRTLQKRVLALIEPAAILLIGAVIGVIMVAVMMAITSLNTAVV